jgi:hypothetical protein
MRLVQKVEVTRGQHGYISMSNCFPSFIVRWILNFVDQPNHENHENWYPTNKSDFIVNEKVNKANSMFALLRCTFQFLDTEFLVPLYKTLVRTHLEFTSSV